MKRPTPPQLAILKRLSRDGEFIHRCSHSNVNTPDSFFYHREAGFRHLSAITVRLLAKRGLIEDFENPPWRWRGSKYRITDAGRAMLNGLSI